MSQYIGGSVSVTSGSNTITGTSTAWLTEVSAGDLFTVNSTGITYEIASVVSDTSLTLTSTYQGTTASGASYTIARDFTPIDGLPYINKGDVETAAILKRAIMMLDGSASNPSTSTAFYNQHNADGTHASYDVEATTLDVTGAAVFNSTISLGGVARGSWGEDVISGTATAGGASTLTDTTKNLGTNSLANMILHVTGGTGIGQVRIIASNTSTVITVSEAFTTTPDVTSTYKVYAISNQTLSQVVTKESANGFVGDFVNSPMTHLNFTSAATLIESLGSRDFRYLLEANTSFVDRYGVLRSPLYYTGTATSGSHVFLADTGATWTTDELKDYICYISSGTGAGQYRWVAGNSPTTLSVVKPWGTAPDSTSVYKLSKPCFEDTGLLIENASANNLTQSANQAHADWNPGIASGWSSTASTDISGPEGTTANLTKHIASATPAVLFARQSGTFTAAERTGSLWIYVPTQSGITSWTFHNDWQDVETGAGLANTVFDSWVRVSSTATVAASRTWVDFNMLVNATTPPTGFIFYSTRGQEEASDGRTAYIDTTTAAVSRPAVAACDLDYAYNYPNTTENQSIIIDFDLNFKVSGSSFQDLLHMSGETYRFIYGYHAAHGKPVTAHGLTALDQPLTTTPAVGTPYRLAHVVSGTVATDYLNGVSEHSYTVSTVTGTASSISIGHMGSGASALNGHIKSIRICDSNLSGASIISS